MKKVMFVLAMLGLGTLCWAGSARQDATNRLDKATSVMHEIMGMPDKAIPEEVLQHATCIAVIPDMVKGGFIFGGEGGKGVATLPRGGWLQCTGVHHDFGWKLGVADRGGSCLPEPFGWSAPPSLLGHRSRRCHGINYTHHPAQVGFGI